MILAFSAKRDIIDSMFLQAVSLKKNILDSKIDSSEIKRVVFCNFSALSEMLGRSAND